ncbi:efflux transporter outer membrane subunit [Rhodospirillum centenum]|uniref:Outer membrane efflux lipoprotein, NodT family protein n=1 Tax=Rhodospirillum centenum (strain ATCC 51521 / SW) TaxID=414684 RepID=B6IUJ8_RHOCS|nr:TolC family protein [Rhodospirillum centenum]ACI99823.1 outer membrane efflux lipoprotein, NodT family protein [Rhodospirillum centenum SW]
MKRFPFPPPGPALPSPALPSPALPHPVARPPLTAGVALATALLALSACAGRTPYARPDLPLADGFAQAAAVDAAAPPLSAPPDRWWESFADPALDRLVTAVLERNNDLAAAGLTLRRARVQAGLSRDALRPQANAGGGGTLRRQDGETNDSYSVSGGLSYEVDLWRRLDATADAATWEAVATEQDLAATRLALIATTAGSYWRLGYLNHRIALGEQSIAHARRTAELVRVQYRTGGVGLLELNEAEQSVLSQEAAQAALVQQRVEARNALAVLLGGPPWPEAEEPQTLPPADPGVVRPGLPAELLGRRPDLRAAELRLRRSLALVDADRAAFYPSIGLTGSGGGSSTSLGDVLANPVATLGVDISLPFVNWNRLSLTLETSELDYRRAVLQFRENLLTALREVDDALSASRQLAIQAEREAGALAAAETAERLYETRYRAGAVPLRSWLDAQERRRSAENALAQTRLDVFQNRVTLFQALGGAP